MKTLKGILEKKGIKPTYQRLKIFEYMSRNTLNHPTVEMIYERLLKEMPTISMTTVYNTLNAFLEKGLVDAITITGTEMRYDSNTASHHHFLCKYCGRIIDIDVTCPVSEGKNAQHGHRVEEVHGYFKGICKDCLKDRKNRAEVSRPRQNLKKEPSK